MKLTFLVLLITSLSVSAQDVFEAARRGNVVRLSELAESDLDTLNAKNEFGFTPLVLAAYRNQPDAVSFLIEKGVNVDEVTPEGTALMGACYTGNITIVKQLLEAGASLEVKNGNGDTPLHFACMSGNSDLIRFLLDQKATTQAVNNNGQRPVDFFEKSKDKGLWKRLK